MSILSYLHHISLTYLRFILLISTLVLSPTPHASISIVGSAEPEHVELHNELNSLLGGGIGQGKRLAITIGANALASQLSIDNQTPVIAIMLTSVEFKRVMEQFPGRPDGSVSSIFADPGPDDQIALAKALSKNSRVLVVRTTESDSAPQATKYSEANEVQVVSVASGDVKSLLTRMDKFDILVAIPDKTLYSGMTMQPIVSSLYRRHKFIIGFSKAMTSAGALASISSDRTQLTSQLVKITKTFQMTGTLPLPNFSQEFSISFNKTLAYSLSINISDEVAIREAILKYKEMERE